MEQLYQNVMSLWHNLHVSMKSVVSWHYLQKDIRTVSSWSLDTVRHTVLMSQSVSMVDRNFPLLSVSHVSLQPHLSHSILLFLLVSSKHISLFLSLSCFLSVFLSLSPADISYDLLYGVMSLCCQLSSSFPSIC